LQKAFVSFDDGSLLSSSGAASAPEADNKYMPRALRSSIY